MQWVACGVMTDVACFLYIYVQEQLYSDKHFVVENVHLLFGISWGDYFNIITEKPLLLLVSHVYGFSLKIVELYIIYLNYISEFDLYILWLT